MAGYAGHFFYSAHSLSKPYGCALPPRKELSDRCLVAVAATALVAALHLAVAIGAIDRLFATRYEGHFCVLAAVGAYYLRHCALGAAITATAAAVAAAT